MSLQSGFSETLSNGGGGGGRIKPNPQHRLSIKPGEFTASPSDTVNTHSEWPTGSRPGISPWCPGRRREQHPAGARPVALRNPLGFALFTTVQNAWKCGRCCSGHHVPEPSCLGNPGCGDREGMGCWERKSPGSIHWMREMQRAPGCRAMQQHPGVEGAVVRGMGDAQCRQLWCRSQPFPQPPPYSTSPPRPCFSPAHPGASVSPLEQGRVQAFRGWQEEPDEPRKDLAIKAGGIPPALRTRAGCEVHPHVCQDTPGIAATSPALPSRPLQLKQGRWQQPRSRHSAANGSGGTRMVHRATPTPALPGTQGSVSPSGHGGGDLSITLMGR